MRPGEVVRFIREWRGETRSELARRANISTDYLKEIERGEKPGSIAVLEQLAAALEVSLYMLFLTDENLIMKELSRREFLQSVVGGVVALTSGISGEVGAGELALSAKSPEALIVLGDTASVKGHYAEALQYYRQAVAMLPKDYRWARYIAEKVAQTHINQGEYDQAETELNIIESAVEEWGADEINRDLVTGLIAEKKGWIENYRGRHDLATQHFQTSLAIAEKWGDSRLVSTSHHFVGRAAIENQMLLLYPSLFASQDPVLRPLLIGVKHIQIAEDLDKGNEQTVAFGKRLEALGFLMMRQTEDAKKLLEESVSRLQSSKVSQAHSLVSLQHLEVLKEGQLWHGKRDLEELGSALDELCDDLTAQRHPYAYVGATLSRLNVKYLLGDYRNKPAERQVCSDLCVMAMLLHFEPQHTYFVTAQEFLSRFIDKEVMTEIEFEGYLEQLPARIIEYRDRFAHLRRFSQPNLLWLHSVLALLKSLRASQ